LATEPVTSLRPDDPDPDPEPDEVPPDDADPDEDPEEDPDEDPEEDPDDDPEPLVTGSDWMEVGALVASGPEVEVL
jgi:hypothetical protein